MIKNITRFGGLPVGTIKFNFYSNIINRTISVEGQMKINWDREMFCVDKVYLTQQHPIINEDVKNEAVEFFKANEADLKKIKNDR